MMLSVVAAVVFFCRHEFVPETFDGNRPFIFVTDRKGQPLHYSVERKRFERGTVVDLIHGFNPSRCVCAHLTLAILAQYSESSVYGSGTLRSGVFGRGKRVWLCLGKD